MKILRIIARLNVGGPARHVVWLTRDLQDAEFQSVLVAGTVPDGEEDMSYFAEENNVNPLYISEMSRELSVKDIISVLKIYRLIRREAPDLIHTHTAKAGTVGRTAAFLYRWFTWRTLMGRPRRVQTVHTFHGHVFHGYYGKLKTCLFLFIEKLLARIATDKIIAISPQQFNEINGNFGIGRKEQFRVIPLGIDLALYRSGFADRRAFRAEVGATDDDIVAGFVGRLTEIKNLSHLLNVAAMYNNLALGAKPSIKFVIIGDGHLRESLQLESERLGVTSILTFLGNRTDTAKFYSGLDIVMLTSMNEGTPLSLVEAMAAERIVISTTVGGVVDLLGDVNEMRDGFEIRERGIGVGSMSVDAYFRGIMCLVENKDLRDQLGLAGRLFVDKQYNRKRLAEDIKGLYREIG